MKVFIILLFLSIISTLNAIEVRTYKFGIVPQQSATQLIEAWAPLIKKLSSNCSCEIDFVTAQDISVFEQNVKKGEYDLVYLNPMHFVQSAQGAGYTALVREEGRRLKGIIVVKKDSSVNNLSDLKNQKIAFPGPTSFAATTLVQNMFAQKGVDIQSVFVKSHESVYLNVLGGFFAAGGAVNRTFEALPESDKLKLKILATTEDVTPHPIAIHKRVDEKMKNIFQSTLIDLEKTPDGKKILKDLELKSLVSAKDSDWDDVRKLLKKMKHLP